MKRPPAFADILRSKIRFPLAMALLLTPRYEEGLELFAEIQKDSKDIPTLQLFAAQALALKGKFAEASAYAKKASATTAVKMWL